MVVGEGGVEGVVLSARISWALVVGVLFELKHYGFKIVPS